MLKSEKAKLYDAKAKQLLSRKDVFANILKYAVREFKDCTLDDIEHNAIMDEFDCLYDREQDMMG